MAGGRWVAVAGFSYVLAWLVGLGIGTVSGAPATTAANDVLAAYFVDHHTAAMVQAYLVDGVAGVALLVFVAALVSTLASWERESPTLRTMALAAGTAAGAVSLLQGLFTQVLADHVAALGNLATVRALYDLNTEGDTYKLLALAVFFGAVALLIFRTHALPTWLGWLGGALAILLVVAGWNFVLSASLQYLAYAVLLVLILVWVAAVSVVSWQRQQGTSGS